jgi:transposase
MSLHPHAEWPIPAETARVAQAAFPRSTNAMRLRDELGVLYQDSAFAALFGVQGQAAASPARLLVVTVLQYLEGLTDRQAADAVRSRIDWKYALGLELTDAGFDYSILSEFRDRLLSGDAQELAVTPLLEACKTRGLLRAGGKQRTDSTHVLAAIRQLNRLELVGETLAATLHQLRKRAPDWVAAQLPAGFVTRYSTRFDEFHLPKVLSQRHALAEEIGADGLALLTLLYEAPTPASVRTLPAVAVLRRVWLQQYVVREDRLCWRSAEELPPNARLIVSPYDVDARMSIKRDTRWTGYKAHLTETCDAARPNLVTQVATTAATTADGQLTATIHAELAARKLLPGEHLVDTSYMEVGVLVTSRQAYGLTLTGPLPPDTSWQARADQGFAASAFAVDWDQQQATCPQGQTSVSWRPGTDEDGRSVITIKFDPHTCRVCPVHAQCTQRATQQRLLKLRPQEQHEALQAARTEQSTAAFKARYALRAGVEGTISQGVHVFDLRHARYRGLAKTRLQHLLIGLALSLARLLAWWAGRPRATTRPSRFATLPT